MLDDKLTGSSSYSPSYLFIQCLAIKDELLKVSYTIATDRSMKYEESTLTCRVLSSCSSVTIIAHGVRVYTLTS